MIYTMLAITLIPTNIFLYLWLEDKLLKANPNSVLSLTTDILSTKRIELTHTHCNFISAFIIFVIVNIMSPLTVAVFFGLVAMVTFTPVGLWLEDNIRNLVDMYNDRI